MFIGFAASTPCHAGGEIPFYVRKPSRQDKQYPKPTFALRFHHICSDVNRSAGRWSTGIDKLTPSEESNMKEGRS